MSKMKSKKAGNQFETLFERACHRSGIGCLRIPDSCRRVSQKKIIPIKSPFDWLLIHEGMACLVDTKTQGIGQNFAASAVNHNQIDKMLSLIPHGAIGGYVVWLREPNKLIFYTAQQLHNLPDKSSLNPKDGLDLGSIEMPELNKIWTHSLQSSINTALEQLS